MRTPCIYASELSDDRTSFLPLMEDLAPAEPGSQLPHAAAMHGIMITVFGATYSTPTPRSDEMFGTMIRRHLQHCLDLDAGDFLPAKPHSERVGTGTANARGSASYLPGGHGCRARTQTCTRATPSCGRPPSRAREPLQ